jgi:NAD(P)-dependent dehydrogenase (short-subunit alcohol dehydrogenase family)
VGAGIAKALAKQGAALVTNDYHLERAQSTTREILAAGGRAVAVQGDVTSLESVHKMIEVGRASFGSIDILVNNAGNAGAGAFVPAQFRDMPIEEWHKFIQVNLYGVLHCTKVLLDDMCDQGWGRIITITSGAYRTGNGQGITLYAAGKAGGVGFSKQLSSEVGRFGVTVNCVEIAVMNYITGAEEWAKSKPIARPGRPADVAAAVVYLASEEASWITGQVVTVNGGSVTA